MSCISSWRMKSGCGRGKGDRQRTPENAKDPFLKKGVSGLYQKPLENELAPGWKAVKRMLRNRPPLCEVAGGFRLCISAVPVMNGAEHLTRGRRLHTRHSRARYPQHGRDEYPRDHEPPVSQTPVAGFCSPQTPCDDISLHTPSPKKANTPYRTAYGMACIFILKAFIRVRTFISAPFLQFTFCSRFVNIYIYIYTLFTFR